MKVTILTKDVRFSMPLPVHMIGFVVKALPNRLFEDMRRRTPPPYCALITKANVTLILEGCLDVLKENKGLEVIHVEGADGAFVSVKL